MIEEKWEVRISGKPYVIEVLTDYLSSTGAIKLNGATIKTWQRSIWRGLPEPFEIESCSAMLTRKSLALNRHELLIDGIKVSKRGFEN